MKTQYRPPDIFWGFILLFILLVAVQTFDIGKQEGLKKSVILNEYRHKYMENKRKETDAFKSFLIRHNNKLPDRKATLYANAISDACEKYGVEAKLFSCMIIAESGVRDYVVSSAGAIGLCQIMPFHFDMLQKEGILKNHRDFYDGVKSIYGGVFIFSTYYKQTGGDVLKTLAYYNAGPSNWRAGLSYAAKVLKIQEKYW